VPPAGILREGSVHRSTVIYGIATLALLPFLYVARMLTPDSFQQTKDVLELMSFMVILVGVPLGLAEYARAVKKEQADREYGTYNALDEKFIEFQGLCLAHPELDVFDVPDRQPHALTEVQRKQQMIIFTMLFSIFERAYLMYHDQSTAIKRKQWSGWDEYIQAFCLRGNFRQAWHESGATFDKDFEVYISRYLSAAQSAASPDVPEPPAAAEGPSE
jgi:hypothetical protein